MDQSFDLNNYINHHIMNSSEWNLPFIKPIQLPEILSLHGVMLIIASIIVFLLFGVLYNKKKRVPTGITNLLEVFVIFIRDEIAVNALGKEDGRKMTPLFCTFFFFILVLNLMGLIPIFVTATANVNVTAGLALITLSFMIFGAIYKNGISGFFKIPSRMFWRVSTGMTGLCKKVTNSSDSLISFRIFNRSRDTISDSFVSPLRSNSACAYRLAMEVDIGTGLNFFHKPVNK